MSRAFVYSLKGAAIKAAPLLYKENPVLNTGFNEAMHLNINFPTVKLKLRSGSCNQV